MSLVWMLRRNIYSNFFSSGRVLTLIHKINTWLQPTVGPQFESRRIFPSPDSHQSVITVSWPERNREFNLNKVKLQHKETFSSSVVSGGRVVFLLPSSNNNTNMNPCRRAAELFCLSHVCTCYLTHTHTHTCPLSLTHLLTIRIQCLAGVKPQQPGCTCFYCSAAPLAQLLGSLPSLLCRRDKCIPHHAGRKKTRQLY